MCSTSPAPGAHASFRHGQARGIGVHGGHRPCHFASPAVAAVQRAGREKCLGYALTARTLWALGADPRFTDLLDSYPEASRLRNEARFALRYLHMNCRGPEPLVLPAR